MTKILAIEAAIGGGSVAVLNGQDVLGKWHGVDTRARSEELLGRISDLLKADPVADKDSLAHVAVSIGPGSYTGIRVGIATALGFSRALNIPASGVSALRAIASVRSESEKLVVVPVGRSSYCWQVFSDQDKMAKPTEAVTGNANDLLEQISRGPDLTVVAHADVYALILADDHAASRTPAIINFGYDIAAAVGTACRTIDDGLSPFYVRENYAPLVSG